MGKKATRFDSSICFLDSAGERRFLFRLINFGKEADELKFIFFRRGMGFVYMEAPEKDAEGDIVGRYAEITYHHDGRVHHKLFRNSGPEFQYRDASGGLDLWAPIAELRDWRPLIRYIIVNYSQCEVVGAEDGIVVSQNAAIFSGEPFVCMLYLGNMAYASPLNVRPTEMIFRINEVALGVDLILWFYKTTYQRTEVQLGKTGHSMAVRSNLIELIKGEQ